MSLVGVAEDGSDFFGVCGCVRDGDCVGLWGAVLGEVCPGLLSFNDVVGVCMIFGVITPEFCLALMF